MTATIISIVEEPFRKWLLALVVAVGVGGLVTWVHRVRPLVPIDGSAGSPGLAFVAAVTTVAALVQITRSALRWSSRALALATA